MREFIYVRGILFTVFLMGIQLTLKIVNHSMCVSVWIELLLLEQALCWVIGLGSQPGDPRQPSF